MIQTVKKLINNKKVLILGFGREGRSTLRLFLEAGGAAAIAIADQAALSLKDLASFEKEAGKETLECIAFHCGSDYQDATDSYDLVMKSPGIVLKKPIEAYRAEILSQMELFFRVYRDRIIGITGTKGKSTTTTLLHHILKISGKDAVLAGNIGIPVFDIVSEIGEKSLLVLELSCHQLEYMTVSPKWGMLLNIYEEHLDHYGTMEKYVASKEKIYVNQKEGDILYVHPSVAPDPSMHKGERILVSFQREGESDVSVDGKRITYGSHVFLIPAEAPLLGEHNDLDIGFVYAICKDFGLGDEAFRKGLLSYSPLPHRLQPVGTIDGITYYDDSISTIDETTIQALNTIQNADTVLIGGMDRDISYVNLEEYLSTSDVAHIILMEETGRRIYREIMENMPDFRGKERLYVVDHLEDAVKLAKEITKKGGSCILSPAAASYGIFQNFEKRGDRFQELVREKTE